MADQIAAPGPSTGVDPAVGARLVKAGRLMRWVALIYAAVALASTASESISSALPPGPSFVRALPLSAALPLALLAVAALIAGESAGRTLGRSWRVVGLATCSAVVLYGAYVAVVFAFEFPDLWPFAVDHVALPSLWVGLILFVLGSAVLVSMSRSEVRVIAGQVGALLVFSGTAVIFLGYIYGDVSVGRLFRPPEITFQAALVSMLLAVGVILIRPASGLLAAASSPEAGGRMLRRFGPIALLLPAMLLAVVESVAPSERIDALVFVSVGLGLFLLALLAVVVRVIDETKVEALTAAAHAERARLGLEQEAPLVSRLAEVLHIVDVGDRAELDVATRFRPGRGSVAGDTSAVRSLPDGSVVAVLVDMTGHGADPAVTAIRVRDLLVHSLALGSTPAEAMGAVGWSAPGDVLASAIAVKLDPTSGAVALASAGHPPAILLTAQDVELLESTGPLLYLDAEASYGEVRFELRSGDQLVLVSDGIVDVQRMRGGVPEPSLLADLLTTAGSTAARTADLVVGFADAEAPDDQSVVVIRRDSRISTGAER